jgi:hypothetical protein
MAGGSREPESEDDQQCQHCGLWWASGGVQSHENNCDWQGVEKTILSLECPHALLRAGKMPTERTTEDTRIVEDAEQVEEIGPPVEGDRAAEVEAGSDPGPNPGATPTHDPSSTEARTDGGPMSVPSFKSENADESEDETTCEGCGGANLDDPEAALPEEALESKPEVREFDYICLDCSTDENGTWQNPIEVFNGGENA